MASYCTAEELGEETQAGVLPGVIDEIIIPAASQLIDKFCNMPMGFLAGEEATERLYVGSGTTVQRIDRCVEVETVEVKDSPSDDDYTEWNQAVWVAASGSARNPNFNDKPYSLLIVTATDSFELFTSGQYTTRRGFRPVGEIRRGVPTVRITARWGEAEETPPLIRQACISQAARWYKRAQSSWADAMASGELGQLLFRQRIDPDIAMMLIEGRMVKPAIGGRP